MDINDLIVDSRLPKLREEVIQKYETLEKLGVIINNKLSEVYKNMGEEFLKQFDEFFTKHNFNISKVRYPKLVAKNELTEIELDLNYDDGILYFHLIKKDGPIVANEIQIQPDFKDEDRIYWKENIRVLTGIKDVNEAVKKITDINKIEGTINSLQKNIDWYSETIEMFDKLDFIYSNPNTGDEIKYDNFEDFFNKI